MGDDDRELVDRYLAGDREAFEVLFERYRGPVTGYSTRMLGCAAAGEDVAVDTFVKVLNGAYKPTGSFRSFLFTVAHRICLDRIRARNVRHRDRIPGQRRRHRTPEHQAALTQRQQRVQQALDRIPERHRAALLLYYHQGLNSRELAGVLGCDAGQVRSRLAYGRRLLGDALALDPEEVMWNTPMTWR